MRLFELDLALRSARQPNSPPPCAHMGQRNVAGLARRGGQRNADKIGLHGIERIGFRIDGDEALSSVASAIQRSSASKVLTVS